LVKKIESLTKEVHGLQVELDATRTSYTDAIRLVNEYIELLGRIGQAVQNQPNDAS
jgi:rhamnose utilization protein RhaD (predicted bifunctional aldolase and dehydrogenase)